MLRWGALWAWWLMWLTPCAFGDAIQCKN
jgi:hypothetical protein